MTDIVYVLINEAIAITESLVSRREIPSRFRPASTIGLLRRGLNRPPAGSYAPLNVFQVAGYEAKKIHAGRAL